MKRKLAILAAIVISILVPCSIWAATIEWRLPIEYGTCYEPAIGQDGTIYVASNGTLLALDPTAFDIENGIVTNVEEATLWSYTAGTQMNTPSVDLAGNVFVQSTPNGVMKLSSSGTPLWTNAFKPEGIQTWYSHAGNSRIAIGREGDVYVSHGGNGLYAISSSDGSQKWYSGGGVGSAVATDGVLYTTKWGSLYPLNPQNGEGNSLGGLADYSTFPSLGGDIQSYVSGYGWLYKINVDATKWNPQFQHNSYYGTGQPAIAADGTIYFGTVNNDLYAIKPDKTSKWLNPDQTPKWFVSIAPAGITGTPAIGDDGILYLAGTGGLAAVDSEDGGIEWQMNWYQHGIKAHTLSSPVIGPDGMIYLVGDDGDDNHYLFAVSSTCTGPQHNSPWPMLGANAQHTFQVQTSQDQLFISLDSDQGRVEGKVVVNGVPTGDPIINCGDGETDCWELLDASTQVQLTMYPNAGYAADYWDDGTSRNYNNPLTVTMNGDVALEAVFTTFELEFPVDGYTPTTVPISAVLDHTVFDVTPIKFYPTTRDGVVKAFNGEVGEQQYGSQFTNGVWGYKNEEGNNFDFLAGYNYTEPKEYLFYDGHSGFDFAVPSGTDILAPADGKLYWATSDPVNGNVGGFNTFYIDHENGYTTWFLHCSGLTATVLSEISQNGFAEVEAGDHVAESGSAGTTGAHLHFEVRLNGIDDEHVIDPYYEDLWE